MYAVVETGGKQFKVFEGDTIRVEHLIAPAGDMVELDRVRLLVKDDGIVAAPQGLASAKVVCQVVTHGRGKKLRVFKKKRRKNYSRTYGHRQAYTELRVKQILE